MRMWGVDPVLLCNKHLLGEHVEMHMLAGSVAKGKSVSGYVTTGLMDMGRVRTRHAALAREMKTRGMRHGSPLQKFSYKGQRGSVDVEANKVELARRCGACAALQAEHD